MLNKNEKLFFEHASVKGALKVYNLINLKEYDMALLAYDTLRETLPDEYIKTLNDILKDKLLSNGYNETQFLAFQVSNCHIGRKQVEINAYKFNDSEY